MHRDTKVLHAGYLPAGEPGVFKAGPQFSSTYASPGDPAANALTYGRFHNPTWTAWEAAVGELEGGQVISFASGMAATSALFGACLKPKDVVVLASDCYYSTRKLAANWLEPMGVTVRLAPTRDNAQQALLKGARLVVVETPTNPQLDVCDIRAMVAAAHAEGCLVAVDNTTPTAYLQRPLALGADLVIASDAKAMTGHSDVSIGHVAMRDPDLATAVHGWRSQHGAIPGPMEVWLAHRSLATLPLRLTKQCATAQQLAEFLSSESSVLAVHYPGLPSHPGHTIARGQMDGFGGVVSFDLGTRERAEKFFSALTLVIEATSFGGVHSTAERRARWGGDAISEGFVRFSVGCEAADDVIGDVAQALRAT